MLYLAQTKVSDAQVPLRVNKNVFRFQVAVDDPLLVHVIESKDDLGSVELGPLLLKALPSLRVQVIEQFTTYDQLHHHVNVQLVLERIL